MLFRISGKEDADADRSNPSSHTNYCYLNTPEKSQRLKCLHTTVKVQAHAISLLKSKVAELVEQKGIVVDEDLHKDLLDTIEQTTGA